MKILLSMFYVIFAFMLSSCVTPEIQLHSKRSLDLSDARLARGGSLCVLTNSKIQRTFSPKKEIDQTKIAENSFRGKGFTIQDLPPGADYGFLILTKLSRGSADSASMIGDTAFLNRQYSYEMLGELYALKPSGSPENLLWRGNAYQIIYNVDSMASEEALLQRILDKFPN